MSMWRRGVEGLGGAPDERKRGSSVSYEFYEKRATGGLSYESFGFAVRADLSLGNG